MQMVHQAKDLVDAHGIRDLLARSGITSHLASPAGDIGPMAPGFIRVSVDNERLDAARRVIAAANRGRKHHIEELPTHHLDPNFRALGGDQTRHGDIGRAVLDA